MISAPVAVGPQDPAGGQLEAREPRPGDERAVAVDQRGQRAGQARSAPSSERRPSAGAGCARCRPRRGRGRLRRPRRGRPGRPRPSRRSRPWPGRERAPRRRAWPRRAVCRRRRAAAARTRRRASSRPARGGRRAGERAGASPRRRRRGAEGSGRRGVGARRRTIHDRPRAYRCRRAGGAPHGDAAVARGAGSYNRGLQGGHGPREHSHPRLRLAVHAADRAAAARAVGVLGDPPAADERRVARRRAGRRASCSPAAPTASTSAAPPAATRRSSRSACPCVGICYGMQLMSHVLRGEVKRSGHREYGQAVFSPRPGGTLFRGLPPRSRVWMSHGDDVRRAPDGFRVVGQTETNAIAAIEDPQRQPLRHAVPPGGRALRGGHEGPRQLPRRVRLPAGLERPVLRRGGDRARARAGRAEGPRHLRAVGRRRLGGGGACSSTGRSAIGSPACSSTTACCARTRGSRSSGASRERLRLNVVTVDASRRFLTKLAGVSDPERKRKIIGREFIEVFKASMRKVGQGRLPRAGHALPRRDRVGLGARALGGDQEPPQRRRAAEGDEVQARRAAALAVQGRGAQGRASSSGSTRSSSTASRSRAPASPCAASAR